MGLVAGGETRVIDGLLVSVYISLHTGDPVLGGNEVTGGAYARQAYAYSKAGSNPTVASNTGVIQFPAATASWGNISYIGIYSALTAGTLLATQALDAAKLIDIDDVARFPIGNLKVQAD
jgi:hypothetical protein